MNSDRSEKTIEKGFESTPARIGEEESKEPEKKKKKKVKHMSYRQRKLIINIQLSRYPVIRKVAKYEYNLFLSGRDMFAPVNG